jgi:histone-lysine N-methyltransferase SETMAR
LQHYQVRGTTVNSLFELLCDKLKPAIWTKCQVLLQKGVALLHGNAHLHTATHTVEILCQLNIEELEQPPHSPDLAPFDYHLFGPVRPFKKLPLCQWPRSEEVMNACLVTQPKTFASDVSRWTKCVVNEGDYVEKLCSCKICIAVVLILKIYCGYILTHLVHYTDTALIY